MKALVDAGLQRYVSGMLKYFARSLGPVLVFIVLAIAVAHHAPAQLRLQTFETDQLTIETGNGSRFEFDVELALNGRQHAQGLMYRRNLGERAGMLFVYAREEPVSMWMQNTYIPLDMLFIARDGYVVRVVERAVPQSLETISSGQPVLGVLEIKGGTAERLGIQPGDRVLYRAFGG